MLLEAAVHANNYFLAIWGTLRSYSSFHKLQLVRQR